MSCTCSEELGAHVRDWDVRGEQYIQEIFPLTWVDYSPSVYSDALKTKEKNLSHVLVLLNDQH